MSDPGTSYRTRDEIQEVRQTRDPITSFKEKIISTNLVTADELKVKSYFSAISLYNLRHGFRLSILIFEVLLMMQQRKQKLKKKFQLKN